jgi:hypothetical protein
VAITLEDKLFQTRWGLKEVQSMTSDEQQKVRALCQTDLRFLANCILRPNNPKKFPSMVEKVHGKIIDGLPKADPKKDILDWDDRDEFIVMASRGMLKSTIGAAFLTQVILCAPDVRILVMSGKIDKAKSILAVARKPFYSNEVLRYLFPEWSIEDKDLKQEEFTCPNRSSQLDLRDPTISLASFDSIKAGGHYELILLDDATNEINSSNIENCEKTHETYDSTQELLEPGGYRIFLATKWNDDDLPAYINNKNRSETEVTGKTTHSCLILPAWILKNTGTQNEVAERDIREKRGQLTPNDVDLMWPEKLTDTFLFKIYRRNRADFYKQYLLDASIEQQKSFTPEILQKQIQSPNELYQIPLHDRAVVIHWDLASVFTGRRKIGEADYSCGLVAVFQLSTNKCFIADARLAHFTTGRDIAEAMIQLYQTAKFFGPVVGHSLEDAMGARNLDSQIMEIAKAANVDLPPIQWELPDSTPNAKNSRIASLATVMKDGKVILLSNIPYLDDIRSQFEKWSIDAKRRKDDAPDCVAQIWQYYSTKMFPKNIENMKPSGPVISWEPELPVEETDPHLEERNDADIEYLNSFTMPHAEH